MKISIFFLLTFLLSSAGFAQTTTINYTYSTEDFVNPERGFYRYSETRSSSYTPLDSATLAGYRLLHSPFSANYSIYCSLIFRYYFLEDFKSGPISNAYLLAMAQDFATARAAGVKLIPRFAYTDTTTDTGCGGGICPPYGDAPKSIVLGHIAQLKPLLQENYDVILGLQMGFVGIWGENYYTDYFGDASQSPFMLSASNWSDRVEVLDSMLAALPASRNVQARYPQMKQKAVYGIAAPITSAAMDLSEAYDGSNKSRIGFHNDCFLASADDFGTYNDYDNAVSDTSILKPYMADDSKYVLVGGETCFPSSFSTCDSQGGNTLEDLKRLHYTYLNADYNNTVNDSWVGICLDSVKTSLGYRLKLNNATLSNTVSAATALTYSIDIENVGFAAPANARNVELILKSQSNNEIWEVTLDVDPRYWFTGSHTFAGSVCISDCMTAGDYDLYLRLSDPAPRLSRKMEYNIRLANQTVWDATTGMNSLQHAVTIGSGTAACAAGLTFERTNYWIGDTTGDWHASIANWSRNKLPELCDEVIIPNAYTVTISAGNIGLARSVQVMESGDLIVENSGELRVVE